MARPDMDTTDTRATGAQEARSAGRETTYAGIDYGLGRSNVDKATGIRFGVIAQHSVMPEAMDDCWQNGRDLTYEAAVAQAKAELGRLETVPELAEWIDEHLCERTPAIAQARYILDGYTVDGDPDTIVSPYPEGLVEHIWTEVEDAWNDAYSLCDSGDRDWLYEADGYKLTNCLQVDVMVLASPYFTYAQYCSPCVPGACNLDAPVAESFADNRAYCLGHDWFDGGAPYPVYSVETGELVPAPAK